MVTLSARETVRHEVGDVTYLIAVPTMLSRADFRREVAAAGAVYHQDGALLNCLRDGVRAVVEDDQIDSLIEMIDSFEFENKKRLEAAAQNVSAEDGSANQPSDDDEADFASLSRKVSEIESAVRAHYPRYALMVADRGKWLDVAPYLAFSVFVSGWEGLDIEYARKGSAISGAVMRKLEKQVPNHIDVVGWKAIMLLRPGSAEVKN